MKTFAGILLCLFVVASLARAQNQPRSGGFTAVPAPGQPPAPAASTPRPAGTARPTTPTQTASPQEQEQMRIVADPATNSLIVYGTAQEFQNIKNILKDLDAVPRQVLLDVLILEVSLDDSESFGVDYEIDRGNTQIFDRTFGSRGAVLSRILSQVGSNATDTALFPSGISGVIGATNTVRALINALKTDSRIKILSSPSVLATDNRPARIQVGSEEPTATGTLTAATGATTPSSSTTIQYKNTGRIVTIIPQVNSQGLVNLQILAEVSQRGTNVTVGQDSYPSFDIRQAETTAVVQDQDTLAIGGIIAENRIRDRRGIPYLMDIPVVGRFFGSTSDTLRRTELIMLITPNVIRNRSEGASVTDEFISKLSDARNELERIARDRAAMKPSPQQLPPTPEPNSTEPAPPQPAPSSVVPGEGGTWTPLTGPAAAMPISLDKTQPGSAVPLEGRVQPPAANSPAPEINREVVKPKPQAFALSLAPVPVVDTKPAARKIAVDESRIWAVQVAALADHEDAESLAAKLRNVGHQAYVLTKQVADKIWHRVRIGEFKNQSDAQELQKSITNKTEFREAYVALN